MTMRKSERILRKVALAIETAFPFSTSELTGWREITPERKAIILSAARAAINVIEQECGQRNEAIPRFTGYQTYEANRIIACAVANSKGRGK